MVVWHHDQAWFDITRFDVIWISNEYGNSLENLWSIDLPGRFFSRVRARKLFFVRHKERLWGRLDWCIGPTRHKNSAETGKLAPSQGEIDHAPSTLLSTCLFLSQKCSFSWIYQRHWYYLSSSTLLSQKDQVKSCLQELGETFVTPNTAQKSWFFHDYWVFSGALFGHRIVQFHSCRFA